MKTFLKTLLQELKTFTKEVGGNIKQGFFIGISFLGTILIIGGVYAYTWIVPANVNTGDTLTATAWNNMVNDLNYLKDIADNSIWKKTGNDIYYNSGSIGIGTTTPLNKLDVNGAIGGNYLSINPQDSTNEGGELQLKGAGSYGTFQIDNFQGHARIHTLGAGKNLEIIGTAGSSGLKFPDGTVQTTAASGGNSWVNVPLSDTADFDLNCEYRAKVNKGSWLNSSSIQNSIYFSKITTGQISVTLVETWWYTTSAQPRYINKGQKGTFYGPNDPESGTASSPIATLQKRCANW